MTLNEIKKILLESGEDGIYIELPKFRSSERLYLNKNGEYFYVTQYGKNIEPTELMYDELESDDWMPRTFDEEPKKVIKTVHEFHTVPTKEQLSLNELLEFSKTYEPTEEDIKKLCQALRELDKQFEQDAKSRIMTEEWLNKPFSTL